MPHCQFPIAKTIANCRLPNANWLVTGVESGSGGVLIWFELAIGNWQLAMT
jgi:hypothetical protein